MANSNEDHEQYKMLDSCDHKAKMPQEVFTRMVNTRTGNSYYVVPYSTMVPWCCSEQKQNPRRRRCGHSRSVRTHSACRCPRCGQERKTEALEMLHAGHTIC